MQTLLQRLTTAVELILVFVLLGAVLVMLSVLLTSTRERLTEGAVLRTLGAARKQLRQAQWVEFALLGVLSAVLALIGAELVTAGLYIGPLDIPYSSLGWAWLWLPPATALDWRFGQLDAAQSQSGSAADRIAGGGAGFV